MEKPSYEEFSEWFDWIIREAEIYDYGRYPVKGTGIWMPYGFALRKHITNLIREELDSTGHEEVLFPLLIPEDLLVKEEEHIRGFRDEVYWVTHGGMDELDVKYALRPTSETSISLMESYWLSSHKQLPKKYYQIVSIFRYETKATRAMIRLREVTTFKEAHTAHASFEDAERQVKEAIEIYSKIFDQLGIPYLIQKRPDWDKFAGALYTIAFDTVLPDGKALQIGTVHNLGQNFSKALDVKVQLPDETNDYVWQTSYGISDRIVATVISVHGDKRGLILPYKVAPIQVIIVPIPFKEDPVIYKKIWEYAGELEKKLVDCKIRVKVDWREEISPGKKYYEWEQKGVPIRLELGKKELEGNYVVVARRDLMKRVRVENENICEKINSIGKEIDFTLAEKAREFFNKHYHLAETIEEAKEKGKTKRGIVEVPWCGDPSCGLKMQEKTELKTLGSPLNSPVWIENKKCPVCGRKAVTSMRLARTY